MRQASLQALPLPVLTAIAMEATAATQAIAAIQAIAAMRIVGKMDNEITPPIPNTTPSTLPNTIPSTIPNKRNKILIIILSFLAIIIIGFVIWQLIPETEDTDETVKSELAEEESNMSVEELSDKYFSTGAYSLDQARDIVLNEVKGVKLAEFSYDFDPLDEENWDKVFQIIVENEESGSFEEVGYDTFYFDCMALSGNNPNYCLKINSPYLKVQCLESLYFFKALRTNDQTACQDLGTKKLGPWCKAILEKNTAVCDNNDFENILFKNNCYAFTNQDISLCENNKKDCYYDYYLIRAIWNNNPSECDDINDESKPEDEEGGGDGEERHCKAIASRDSDFCKNEYLIDKLRDTNQ